MRQLSDWTKSELRNLISLLGYSVRRTDPLTALADRYRTDKGSSASAHGYCRIYHNRFKHLRKSEITLVEIGVGRRDAPSLRMWTEYFQLAHVFGFDKDDFSGVNITRCTIVRGDMSVEQDLIALTKLVNRPITILIDDASHASHHQQFALGTIFPFLSSGGFYAIEDMHWPYAKQEPLGASKTREILRRFSVTGIMESLYISENQRRYLENNTESLTLYDSLTASTGDVTDALAIIVKK